MTKLRLWKCLKRTLYHQLIEEKRQTLEYLKMKANLKATNKNSWRWDFWIKLSGCPYKAKCLITQILPRNFVFMLRNIKPMDWSPQWISESSKVCVCGGGSWLDRIKKRQYDLFLKEGGWMSVTVSNLHALRLFPLVSHSPYLQSSHLRLEEARNTSGQLPHVVYG